MKQRDNEWRQARLGDVTASRFKDVLTAPRTKAAREAAEWSQTSRRYMIELRASLLRGQPFDLLNIPATRWGDEWERSAFADALPIVEDIFGAKLLSPTDDYAYIHHPSEKYIGCSPDGIIGDDWLLELKCPYNPVNHDIAVDRGTIPPEHIPQVQGSLWVTGRKGYAFGSFDPRLRESGLNPLFLCRVERDDEYIDNVLAPRVIAFRDWLRAEYEKLVGKEPF